MGCNIWVCGDDVVRCWVRIGTGKVSQMLTLYVNTFTWI